MYEKRTNNWTQYFDFLILDVLCQQLAFIIAYALCHEGHFAYYDREYLNLAAVFVLTDFCVAFMFDTFRGARTRGYYKEFVASLRHVLLTESIVFVYLFVVRSINDYSGAFIFSMVPIYVFCTYIGRLLRKVWLLKAGGHFSEKSLIIVSPRTRIDECIKNFCETTYNSYSFVGLIVSDENLKGSKIGDFPVVENYDNALEYIRREWVDEVFFGTSLEEGYPTQLTDRLNQMGVVVHIPVTRAGSIMENTQQVERMGNYMVLTTGINCATPMQLWLKRLMDIAGGLVGCIITALLFVFLALPIYISSPGPVFFVQERVGRNGKKFKLYKFRTMVVDAEQRKRELVEAGNIDGGRMFKLEDDPRIIGNKVLPDGTVKKGIGSFLRETSLDEFPQMFNVLRGEMSLVGTRPPTLDEWEKYDTHHRARLAFRPGITGLWQINGRSKITDFEEVVKLDMEYIDEWTLGLDIKIILKTIGVIFKRSGAL